MLIRPTSLIQETLVKVRMLLMKQRYLTGPDEAQLQQASNKHLAHLEKFLEMSEVDPTPPSSLS